MKTITLRHLDNREFARIYNPVRGSIAAMIDAVCFEFECDEDDITFDENEDGDVISVYGEPRAQSYVSYGRF